MKSEGGASAVEFALFAPILAFMLLTIADLGLALGSRMAMDHVLRAGAGGAMSDPGEPAVADLISKVSSEEWSGTDNRPDFSVGRYCECPSRPETRVPARTVCTLVCAEDLPSVFYLLEVSGSHDGMFLPPLKLSSSLRVDVR